MNDDRPHFVYRYYNEAGHTLYIGCTVNLVNREKQHRSQKPWFADVVRREVDEYPDRAAGRAAEAEAIRRERPIHNLQLAIDYIGREPVSRIGYRRIVATVRRHRARMLMRGGL